MRKYSAWLAAAAVLAASTAASAEQLAERVDRPIAAVSSVVKQVEERADFGAYSSVRYNPVAHSYVVYYTAKNGTPEMVVIDAITSQERS